MSSNRHIKYLKNSAQFSKSAEDNKKYKHLLSMGNAGGKSIFHKIPVTEKDLTNPNKSKFQHPWISKDSFIPEEIIASEGFRIMLGDNFSPKYRFYMENGKPTTTMSRLLDNFTPWVSVANSEQIEISEEDRKLFGYPKLLTKYDKMALSYLKLTSQLENFNKMLAACLLFGKDDLHGGNWGVVEENGKKFAATVDHGHALGYDFSLYNLLYHYGHRKERLLTPEFVAALRDIANEFDNKRQSIKLAITSCIQEMNSANIKNVPSVATAMSTLDENKNKLMTLSYQIEAEMAINQGNPNALREALKNLPTCYVPESQEKKIPSIILSLQNYRDGFVSPDFRNLRLLIKARLFNDCDTVHLELDDSENYIICSRDPINKSQKDIAIENELLSVYDEVAKELSNENKYVINRRF